MCGQSKNILEFAWRRIAKKRDSYCRPCRAEYKRLHYAANRQRYIDNAAQRKRALAEENTSRLVEFLRMHPCTDCGEGDPLVLEFDHVGRKRFGIGSAMQERNWAEIEREISQCEVLCELPQTKDCTAWGF